MPAIIPQQVIQQLGHIKHISKIYTIKILKHQHKLVRIVGMLLYSTNTAQRTIVARSQTFIELCNRHFFFII